MNVLGIKILGHDTGAALISDEKVIAIAEERLNRVKHSPNMFPFMSIDYCLDYFNLRPEQIDLIVIDQIELRSKFQMDKIFVKNTGNSFSNAKIEVINHHDAHAASAFFCSPFSEAGILIYDGSGEKYEHHLGVTATETETLYRGFGNRIHQIQKTTHLRRTKKFLMTFGIGKLYQLLSEVYLGFGPYNEGKMMGLAPYGDPSFLEKFSYDSWFMERDGSIVCNANIHFPGGKNSAKPSTIMTMRNIFSRFCSHLDFLIGHSVFEKITLPKPPRAPEIVLPDKYYSSVAYAGQKILEKVAFAWGNKLKNATGSKNICVAGGVGLNIDVNLKFLEDVGFENIFVQPASSDTGVALGCALFGWHMILGKDRFWNMEKANLGREYSDVEIITAISENLDKIAYRKSNAVEMDTAKLLSEGKIIGWFQGRSEYGPRALGQRSILFDPRKKDGKEMLNGRVKHRENWRPFAASVLKEKSQDWFEYSGESPFMLLAVRVKNDKQAKIPSVTHVDGTCRIQTVRGDINQRYHELLKFFDSITGVPLILNTSFNLAGEPIVETPHDAMNCFLSTEIDNLVLGDYIVSKILAT